VLDTDQAAVVVYGCRAKIVHAATETCAEIVGANEYPRARAPHSQDNDVQAAIPCSQCAIFELSRVGYEYRMSTEQYEDPTFQARPSRFQG
jgi:hypothetical protein